jgi:hypothetical protein
MGMFDYLKSEYPSPLPESEGERLAMQARSQLEREKSERFHPVGRAAQAAVCNTAQAGAIPARDSNSQRM